MRKHSHTSISPSNTELQELTDEALRSVAAGIVPPVIVDEVLKTAKKIAEEIEKEQDAHKCPPVYCPPMTNHNQTLVADE